jgi:DNA polymerase-3 subunit alpha
MMAALDDALRIGQSYQRDQQSNQIDIFSMLGSPARTGKKPGDIYPQVAEWSAAESLAFEKEALGFYISGHPLDKYDKVIRKITSGTVSALRERAVAGEVKLAGVVWALKLKNTKKGERYACFNLEDKSGFMEVIAWPDVYRKSVDILGSDDPIFVKGRMDVGEERVQLIANEITRLAEVSAKFRQNGNGKAGANGERLELYVRESEVSAEDFVRLRDTLLEYPGPCTVFLHLLARGRSETVIELPDQVRVASSPELEESLVKALGGRVGFRSLDY